MAERESDGEKHLVCNQQKKKILIERQCFYSVKIFMSRRVGYLG